MNDNRFSTQLKAILSQETPPTIREVSEIFAEKSIAFLILVLMIPSALPIPTGGITNIFEIIVMLFALELTSGRHGIWLPKKWENKNIPQGWSSKASSVRIIAFIERVEKLSKPRWSRVVNYPLSQRIIGMIIFLLAFCAFIAPPFSGLDTLPSVGIVLIALAIVFNDFLLVVLGIVLVAIGIYLIVILGSFVLRIL